MADRADQFSCWDFAQSYPLITGLIVVLAVVAIYFFAIWMGWLEGYGGSSDNFSSPPARKKKPSKKPPAKRAASEEDADVEELIEIINS